MACGYQYMNQFGGKKYHVDTFIRLSFLHMADSYQNLLSFLVVLYLYRYRYHAI